MKYKIEIIIAEFLLIFSILAQNDPCLPQQVHLSLGNEYYLALDGVDINYTNASNSTINYTNNTVFIMFNTDEKCEQASVELIREGQVEVENLTQYINFYTTKLNENQTNYSTYIHTFLSENLQLSQEYSYNCYGNETKLPEISAGPFSFRPPNYDSSQESSSSQTKLIFFGNFDALSNGTQTYERLLEEVRYRKFTNKVMFHLGGIASDMQDDNGERGNEYMNKMQDIIAQIPYMITYGEQEQLNNYTFVGPRFRAPTYQHTNLQYYSFNLQNVHIFTINYKLYYDQEDLRQQIEDWLIHDLTIANTEENRSKRPWIINFSNYPFYCSSSDSKCSLRNTVFKKLNAILHKYNVDLFINSNINKYERTQPVYNQSAHYDQVNKNTTMMDVYKNPRGTVFVTEGLPGNNKYSDPNYAPNAYSKFVSDSFGYGILTIISKTHLLYERKDSTTGYIEDNFMIQKDALRTFNWTYTPLTTKKDINFVQILIILGLIILFIVAGWLGFQAFKPSEKSEAELLYEEELQEK